MQKKIFEEPKVKVIRLADEDVITSSIDLGFDEYILEGELNLYSDEQ